MRIREKKNKIIEAPKSSKQKNTFSYEFAELRRLDTQLLVELLKKPDIHLPTNSSVRNEIISIIRHRKGHSFIQKFIYELPANASLLQKNTLAGNDETEDKKLSEQESLPDSND